MDGHLQCNDNLSKSNIQVQAYLLVWIFFTNFSIKLLEAKRAVFFLHKVIFFQRGRAANILKYLTPASGKSAER